VKDINNIMKTIHELKEMIAEPASKDWFKKHGLPKGIKGKMCHKMSSGGELKKAEKGEKKNPLK
jgi:hypothetical protein